MPAALAVVAVMALAAPPAAEAHDPGLSAVELRLNRAGAAGHLVFALREIELLVALDADGDGHVGAGELAEAQQRLEALALAALEIRRRGAPLRAEVLSIRLDESEALHFEVSYETDAAAGASAVVASEGGASALFVRSTLLPRLARGHRQYMSARDEMGSVLAERVLDATAAIFELNTPGAAPPPRGWRAAGGSWTAFVVLGVEHILTGYDHLLFLLGLLLAGGRRGPHPSPTPALSGAIPIITSFTIAHSFTLALATLDLVRLPARIVAPLIASSIVYVGVENVLRREPRRRWLVTFAFGLVHGFGFASVLRDLGVGSGAGEVVVPLLGFNAGVELGQLAVAALALPLLLALRREPSFDRRWAPACSLAVTLAGGIWLVERTLLP